MKTAAETFRPNPDFDAEDIIKTLGVGEALVSTLEKKGVPSIVQRTLMRPPSSRLGPLTDSERKEIIAMSPVGAQYEKDLDRESAYEILKERAAKKAEMEAKQQEREEKGETDEGERAGFELPDWVAGGSRKKGSRGRQTVVEAAVKSVARTVATQIGRALVRGILGSLKKGR